MPPKHNFLGGDTIGCALLKERPLWGKIAAAISEASGVSSLWECQ